MNLSFLSPLFFIGLAAVALPIIAHLISQKTGIQKRFPAVSFLISSQGDLAARSRIRDILLLVLRALILVLIVLVFAKPAVFSFTASSESSPKSVGILIDNSFSMGYEDNFGRAKDIAKQLIDSMQDGSFAIVAPLVEDKDIDLQILRDKTTLKNRIDKIELSNSFTDNNKRSQTIYSELQNSPNEEKKVILITDYQKNGWGTDEISEPWLELIDVSPDSTPSNHAVSKTEVKSTTEAITVEATVSNYSENPLDELLTRTRLGEEEIREFFNIKPEEITSKKFKFSSTGNEAGDYGSVMTSNDKLKVDDLRSFIMHDNSNHRILVVDGDPREDSRLSETYYLTRALETISELSGNNIDIIDNDSFLDQDISDYEIIYLANIGEISPRISKELEKFISSGGSVVIFLGNRTKANSYNILLGKILPGEINELNEGKSTLSSNQSDIFSKEIAGKFNQARISKLFNIKPYHQSEVLIKSSNEKPFLIKKDHGKGNIFIFTSTADTSWNNLSITPVFVPIIQKIQDSPNIHKFKNRNYLVGDIVAIERMEESESVVVISPKGDEFEVNVETNEFADTQIPGVYRVERDGKTVYRFAVNIDPKESNLKKLAVPAIKNNSHEKGSLVKVFKEIWRYFLWGAIALFISEATFRSIFSR